MSLPFSEREYDLMQLDTFEPTAWDVDSERFAATKADQDLFNRTEEPLPYRVSLHKQARFACGGTFARACATDDLCLECLPF